jgi:hypothetical protein
MKQQGSRLTLVNQVRLKVNSEETGIMVLSKRFIWISKDG